VKAMGKMNDDIDDLIRNMKHQFDYMRTDYASQLNSIEKEFERERYDILKRNAAEITALFKQHEDVEKQYMKLRAEDEENYAKQLEEVRSGDANQQAE